MIFLQPPALLTAVLQFQRRYGTIFIKCIEIHSKSLQFFACLPVPQAGIFCLTGFGLVF
jgi:hypothetical protein